MIRLEMKNCYTILIEQQRQVVEQAKFAYSPFGKETKTIGDQGKERNKSN